MEAGRPRSRKRKLGANEAPAPAAATEKPSPKSAVEDQDPPLAGADGGANDRISQLPDGVLGDVISLLPTKDGARTQILASRWRHLWRSAPLNLDHHRLCRDRKDLDAVVSRILSAHPGPGRRFCAPVYHLFGDRAETADAWLWSPALDNLYELELCSFDYRFGLPYPSYPSEPQPTPAAAFRFSETLCVAIIGDCHLPDSTAQGLHFPKLKKLGLERVSISESSLHSMMAGCPALECLLIQHSFGFRCIRINSISLTSIGVKALARHKGHLFEELIIENAPCLERFLQLSSSRGLHVSSSGSLHVSVIFAPKLKILGCLFSGGCSATLTFDLTVIKVVVTFILSFTCLVVCISICR
ncbi:hypothetical protein ACQ4PT_045220 [Festuca glaucescens]